MTTVIHPAGEIIDFETRFELNQAIGEKPQKTGRFERVDYTTEVYEDGVIHPKYCNVYLPWCYNPADKSRKYNVMYYQHGNICDPELFTEPAAKATLDSLFDSGEIEPCIMVFTTYYFDVTKDVETRRTTGDVPAGDGNYGGGKIAPNFYQEVVKDIIPAVELKYNTWLTENSDEAIKATRDHRGFSGYSRGCVCTWYILHNDFEYFRYYAPMSCMTTAGTSIRTKLTEEQVVDYLTAPMKAHPELPFFIYASNGYPNDVMPMTEQMKYLPKAPVFSYGQDPEKNNIYFALSDFPHSDLYAPYYFYNSLKVLFH
ncbi:MAG: hypothetical protein IKR59_07735 [Lachnospiraceae bacterium]|nr:hypothetical protein [Lachnospiraceae bacterium]